MVKWAINEILAGLCKKYNNICVAENTDQFLSLGNDFHVWPRHSWNSLHNRFASDKIGIHDNPYIILYSLSITVHILVIYILKLPSTHQSYDWKCHVLIIKFETGCEKEQYIISFGSLFLLNNGQFKIHWYEYIVLGNLYMANKIYIATNYIMTVVNLLS